MRLTRFFPPDAELAGPVRDALCRIQMQPSLRPVFNLTGTVLPHEPRGTPPSIRPMRIAAAVTRRWAVRSIWSTTSMEWAAASATRHVEKWLLDAEPAPKRRARPSTTNAAAVYMVLNFAGFGQGSDSSLRAAMLVENRRRLFSASRTSWRRRRMQTAREVGTTKPDASERNFEQAIDSEAQPRPLMKGPREQLRDPPASPAAGGCEAEIGNAWRNVAPGVPVDQRSRPRARLGESPRRFGPAA